jgi:hypothetical protein
MGRATIMARIQTLNTSFRDLLTVHQRRAFIGYTITKNLKAIEVKIFLIRII